MNVLSPAAVPISDMGGAIIFFLYFLIGVGVLLTALVTLVESAILRLLRWGIYLRCFSTSFLMNLVSFAAGYVFVIKQLRHFLYLHQVATLLISFVLSILIEWGVLVLRKPGERWLNLRASIIANLASYVLLIAPTYLWLEEYFDFS